MMTRRSNHLALTSLLSLLLLNVPLCAEDETAPESISEEHVSVRSRELDARLKERVQVSRAEEQEEEAADEEERTVAHAALPTQLLSAPWNAPQTPTRASLFGFPTINHVIVSIADNGRSVEIEDGSHWEIATQDSPALQGWRYNDQIVVTPNYSWFGQYPYYLVNKNDRNSYVQAKLWVGPLQYGARSHWIVDIDPIGGHVRLENDMIWCMDPKDSDVFRSWAVNDHIIFGAHESWFSQYTHILINVNMDEHVKARQY